MWRSLGMVIGRELLLGTRNRQSIVNPLVFYVMAVALFPLGVRPDEAFLVAAAAGIIWVAALLSTIMSMDGLFRQDLEDGSLDQLLLTPQPLYMLTLGRMLAAWLRIGVPLILITPVLGLMLYLEGLPLQVLMLTLLLGLPALCFVGCIGAALTAATGGGGVLLVLLVLPLQVPVLIFASAAVRAAGEGLPVGGYLAALGAMSLAAFALAPFAVAGGLRISVAAR